MQPYIKNKSYSFTYPDEMEKIITYLNNNGKIQVSHKTIESLYYDFSDERYCAGWMCVNDNVLEEFADWLEECDI
jgi:hypothetical protein